MLRQIAILAALHSIILTNPDSLNLCLITGTIGAIGNNGIGVTSINPDSNKFRFLIGKGLRDSGSGSTSGIIKAVEWCYNNDADIISMSLGCDGCSDEQENTVMDTVYNDGVLIVAAAGNSGNSAKSYPASYPSVMSVAATDSNRNVASFSQVNDQVEIAAPGVAIRSTTTRDSGTGFRYADWDGKSNHFVEKMFEQHACNKWRMALVHLRVLFYSTRTNRYFYGYTTCCRCCSISLESLPRMYQQTD